MIEGITQGGIAALPLALVAGLVAGMNPCCIPIYPAAAGCCAALRRESLAGNAGVATAFVLGGCMTTTALGVAAGLAGQAFGSVGEVPAYVIASIPILFGLHLLGAVRLPVPAAPKVVASTGGPLGAVAAGAMLGLVIAPCATPVLAGLLAYVASTGNPWWGGALLFTYGIGLGVPVLLLGTVAASLVTRLASGAWRRVADAGSGIALVGVGLYLVWIA